MTEQEMESGYELVLDGRKWIAAFAILIVVCGCFFVLGYMAGKHQWDIASNEAPAGAVEEREPMVTTETDTEDAAPEPREPEAVQQEMEWYRSVNKKAGEPGGEEKPVSAARSSASAPVQEKAAPPAEASRKSAAASVTYTVQIGAFKRRPEADAHAKNIRAKGFETRVEAPKKSGDLYLVKVGKYGTRAEAVAVQLRLKKSGVSCFVKTN